MRKSIIAAAVAASALTVGAGGAQAKDVKIGVLLGFKGVYAKLAEQIMQGYEIALDNVGRTINGNKIVILKADNENKPPVAIQKARKMVKSDGVTIIGGVISSGVGVAMAKFAKQQKVPVVVTLAVADVITGKFCNRYIFRSSFAAYALQSGIGQYWAKKYKTAVAMGPDYAAGHAMVGGFKAGFEKAGGKVKEVMWSAYGKTQDWGPFLAKAKASGADMIFSFYAGKEAIQVVKQHAAFGLKMPLYGGHWLYDQALWPAMGEKAVLGAIHHTTHVPALDNPANKAFVAAYNKKYGTDPDINAYLGYENAMSILLAIKAQGKNVTREGTAKALKAVKYESPRGTFHFSKDNNAQLPNIYLVQIAKGSDGKLYRKPIATLPGGQDKPGCKMK
jgi:branched-chain amino acid transport system substrate-binding protein